MEIKKTKIVTNDEFVQFKIILLKTTSIFQLLNKIAVFSQTNI